MIPNLYLGNGCFTKHPFKSGCLGFQVAMLVFGGCVSPKKTHVISPKTFFQQKNPSAKAYQEESKEGPRSTPYISCWWLNTPTRFGSKLCEPSNWIIFPQGPRLKNRKYVETIFETIFCDLCIHAYLKEHGASISETTKPPPRFLDFREGIIINQPRFPWK